MSNNQMEEISIKNGSKADAEEFQPIAEEQQQAFATGGNNEVSVSQLLAGKTVGGPPQHEVKMRNNLQAARDEYTGE